ncbi:MAG: NAD(+) synthase [Spirochaetota bacterium]
MSLLQRMKINPQAAAREIEEFVKAQVKTFDKKGVVIGLSGGMDSTVCAYLCSRALGRGKVLALILPEKDSNPVNIEHARLVAETLQLHALTIELTPILELMGVYRLFSDDIRTDREKVEGLLETFTRTTGIPSLFSTGVSFLYGKKQPRLKKILKNLLLPYTEKVLALTVAKIRTRMIMLYYQASLNNCLVVGTTDKSEWMIGFYDKYGDGANDITLLRHLYKTQIRQLAEYLGIPREITQKPSSGDLMAGLPNEVVIGLSYEKLDQVLFALESGIPDKEIAGEAGVSAKSYHAIKSAMAGERVRRNMPVYLNSELQD